MVKTIKSMKFPAFTSVKIISFQSNDADNFHYTKFNQTAPNIQLLELIRAVVPRDGRPNASIDVQAVWRRDDIYVEVCCHIETKHFDTRFEEHPICVVFERYLLCGR